jgi:hypothetical protein
MHAIFPQIDGGGTLGNGNGNDQYPTPNTEDAKKRSTLLYGL